MVLVIRKRSTHHYDLALTDTLPQVEGRDLDVEEKKAREWLQSPPWGHCCTHRQEQRWDGMEAAGQEEWSHRTGHPACSCHQYWPATRSRTHVKKHQGPRRAHVPQVWVTTPQKRQELLLLLERHVPDEKERWV